MAMDMQSGNMFESQHYMDMMPDHNKKRGRDDEQDLAVEVSSFCEHRNKRQHSLPLRTSPKTAQQWLDSANVTPLNASPAQVRRSHLESDSFLAPGHANQQDTDMDMESSVPPLASRHLAHLTPDIDPSNGTHRMPTPIQPSFAAQVRGQQHEWAGNGVQPESAVSPHSIPRSMAADDSFNTVQQNNRRLPSPISECDDPMHNSLRASSPAQAMEHPNAHMDMEPRSASVPPETDPDSPGPSPERRGHMRSKHTINTWTWQPGMKKSFSIGYRADCEKCRLKVPGHFNHIVIS